MAKFLKTQIKGRKMQIYLYFIIFIMGTFFGSFYTLAVYRIPKRQDIVHTHSYCPNCNHKLGFLDLFPIFSYILLGGKCRYCKQKIRPRYLILEILSGLVFVFMAWLIGLDVYFLNVKTIMNYVFVILYFTFFVLEISIFLENKKVDKYVGVYGGIVSILYMIYLCITIKY